MRKLMIVAAATAALAVTACDGPAEERGEEIDDANNADGVFTEGPAEEYGEMLDESGATSDAMSDDTMTDPTLDPMVDPLDDTPTDDESTPPVLTDNGMEEPM